MRLLGPERGGLGLGFCRRKFIGQSTLLKGRERQVECRLGALKGEVGIGIGMDGAGSRMGEEGGKDGFVSISYSFICLPIV